MLAQPLRVRWNGRGAVLRQRFSLGSCTTNERALAHPLPSPLRLMTWRCRVGTTSTPSGPGCLSTKMPGPVHGTSDWRSAKTRRFPTRPSAQSLSTRQLSWLRSAGAFLLGPRSLIDSSRCAWKIKKPRRKHHQSSCEIVSGLVVTLSVHTVGDAHGQGGKLPQPVRALQRGQCPLVGA